MSDSKLYNIIKNIILSEINHSNDVNILNLDFNFINENLKVNSLDYLMIISEIENTLNFTIDDEVVFKLLNEDLTIDSFINKILEIYNG